jgi:hypothetical protein
MLTFLGLLANKLKKINYIGNFKSLPQTVTLCIHVGLHISPAIVHSGIILLVNYYTLSSDINELNAVVDPKAQQQPKLTYIVTLIL